MPWYQHPLSVPVLVALYFVLVLLVRTTSAQPLPWRKDALITVPLLVLCYCAALFVTFKSIDVAYYLNTGKWLSHGDTMGAAGYKEE